MIARPFMRVGRPSLLQTAARTAVVAGTATAVTGRTARRQAERGQRAGEAAASEQQLPPPPPPPPPPAVAPTPAVGNLIEQLRQLGQLRDSGVLAQEEFDTQKARLLNE